MKMTGFKETPEGAVQWRKGGLEQVWGPVQVHAFGKNNRPHNTALLQWECVT